MNRFKWKSYRKQNWSVWPWPLSLSVWPWILSRLHKQQRRGKRRKSKEEEKRGIVWKEETLEKNSLLQRVKKLKKNVCFWGAICRDSKNIAFSLICFSSFVKLSKTSLNDPKQPDIFDENTNGKSVEGDGRSVGQRATKLTPNWHQQQRQR